ncbi:hypothetical protein [Brachyspira pulli]|uniref:hypothetical protein n=1 Tax=Brachyspira pulli TaxID=310721 RepID=UPI0030055A33
MKKYILVSVFILFFISCYRTPTTPEEESGFNDVYLRDYKFVVDDPNILAALNTTWTDEVKEYFNKHFFNTFTKRIIYTSSALNIKVGYTDDNCNFYELLDYPNRVKTRFKFATNVTDNGKEYIGAVFYDEKLEWGNQWRLIYIDENGAEQGFYGDGENDPNKVPTSFIKYDNTLNPLGYIRIK